VLAFLFVISRRRIWFYLGAPTAVFLGLSLFVTYMGERVGIREELRDEQAGIFDRFDRASVLVTNFQLLDLASPRQVVAFERLNYNWIVGAAVMSHEDGGTPFAYGATIPLWALIPRAVWPDKPDIGGARNVFSDFTDIRFAAGRATLRNSTSILGFRVC
jgi:hypothetical protein